METTAILPDTTLTQSQIDAFHDLGYHIHGRLFSEQEVDALCVACERICQGHYENGVGPDCSYWSPGGDPLQLRKFDNCWKADRTIATAVLSPRLGHIAAQLISAPSIRMWHDQLLHKPALGGKVVVYHQDWAYWQAIDVCETVTCWIALDDVRADSGPMIFLQGSHKLGLVPAPNGFSGDDTFEPKLPPETHCPPVPVIIPAGYVSFHHGLTLHGSSVNTSPFKRRALVSHLMSGACRYRAGYGHSNLDFMVKYSEYPKPGQRFCGPQFPLIYPVR